MEKIRLLKFRFLVDPPTPFVVFLLSRYIHYFALSISAITLWFPKFVSVLCTSSMKITFQVTMARLYNWDVKRRKDQKAVAANWKENLIQSKAEKKTWFSWKLKRKNMFQLKTEKTWNTRFSWSVINNSYSWSENNVQPIWLRCSADLNDYWADPNTM